MIVFIWAALWAYMATTLEALLFPALALLVRAAYHRDLGVISVPTITIGIFVLVSGATTVELHATEVWTSAAKTVFFAALSVHAVRSLSVSVSRFPLRFAQMIHLYPRVLLIVVERGTDFYQSLKARLKSWLRHPINNLILVVSSVASILIECSRISNQLQLMITARGVFPHPRTFRQFERPSLSVCVGDVVLICCALMFVVVAPPDAIPQSIQKIVMWAKVSK
jgi:hypothetical protein